MKNMMREEGHVHVLRMVCEKSCEVCRWVEMNKKPKVRSKQVKGRIGKKSISRDTCRPIIPFSPDTSCCPAL